MHAENFVVDDGSQRQIVEYFSAVSPDIDWTILAEALVVEAIDLGNLSALVVASDQRDAFWVSDLEGEQKQERFHRVVASVNEIAHKQVIRIGTFSSHLE